MHDKRKLKRREMLYNLEIHDATTDEAAGWLIDINAEGIRISGERVFARNQRCDLVIKLNEEISGKTAIPFSAKVRWTHPEPNQQFFATGLQLDTIANEDYEALIGFMAKFAMRE